MRFSSSRRWLSLIRCLETHEKMRSFHVLPFLIVFFDKPVLKMKIAIQPVFYIYLLTCRINSPVLSKKDSSLPNTFSLPVPGGRWKTVQPRTESQARAGERGLTVSLVSFLAPGPMPAVCVGGSVSSMRASSSHSENHFPGFLACSVPCKLMCTQFHSPFQPKPLMMVINVFQFY